MAKSFFGANDTAVLRVEGGGEVRPLGRRDRTTPTQTLLNEKFKNINIYILVFKFFPLSRVGRPYMGHIMSHIDTI
jgi:hypothetical protein